MSIRIKLLTLLTITFLPFTLLAEEPEYIELQSRYSKYHISYVLNDDFTVHTTSEIQIKVLTEASSKRLKKQYFSHSTSIEEFEILDAYTIKSDGSRVAVPKDNYQVTVNKGKGNNGPVFSDRTRLTIVFPELEVDDSIYYKVKAFQKEPMFPDNFAVSQYFWNQNAHDDVRISFDLPENLQFQYQVRQMKEDTSIMKGRKTITLTYQNQNPVKDDRKDFSVWDESGEAGYALSTFMNYESLAKAYGERANPKAIPTQRVEELAKEIVGTETSKKEQARLLYDWVTTNISYGGNCIGVGAVVPHNLDFILDNRMGDCKDHAILIDSLFSTVGINSTQALINSGSTYTLPMIPRVSSVNHVINYIPEWDMFIDSTNSQLPFDQLAMSLSDKQVLLVENYQEGLKTPATKVGDNRQELNSTMEIQPDGSIQGTIEVRAKGLPATQLRGAWRHTTKEQEDEWLKNTFSSQSQIGSGVIEKDDPNPLLSEYSYAITFEKPEFILPKGAGAFYPGPLVSTPMPVYMFLNYDNKDIEGYDIVCSNGYSIERLTYIFPEEIKILAKPESFEIHENHLHFKASYQQDGNKLTIVREMDDQTPGNVCSADLMNKQRQTAMKIAENLKAQIVYQH